MSASVQVGSASSAAEADIPPPLRARVPILRAGVALLLSVGVLAFALPRATGAPWAGIGAVLAGITVTQVGVLSVLWAAGLVAYSFVLTGALPGLSRRRALTLNLTGSAVSNVAPLGGALGVATNLAMARVWRFRPTAFAAFTVVTNIWDVLGKLCLPLVALLVLLVSGGLTSPTLQATAVVTSGALVALVLLIVVVLRSDRAARLFARAVSDALRTTLPARFAPRVNSVESSLLDTRGRVRGLIGRTWPQLTAGMVSYLGLQACLLWACLHVAGATLPIHVVLAGFAVERMLTLAVVTPGGTGLAEAGSASILVALGGDPLAVAAGVLLYRGFTFLLEIPVGGLLLGGWLIAHPRGEGRIA